MRRVHEGGHLPVFLMTPNVMGGKPCIRGMRVTVGTIVGLVASGHSEAAGKALPNSLLGKACAYALSLWGRLEVIFGDGWMEVDNNPVENGWKTGCGR